MATEDVRPLPPIKPDPLADLHAARAAMLPAMRALFEDPNNAAAKAQLQALLPAERAECAMVAHLLRPRRAPRPERSRAP